MYQSKTNIWSVTLKLLGATTNREPNDCWNFQGKTALLSSNQVYTLLLKWINVSAPQHLLGTSAPTRHLSAPQHLLSTIVPIWCLEPALSPLCFVQYDSRSIRNIGSIKNWFGYCGRLVKSIFFSMLWLLDPADIIPSKKMCIRYCVWVYLSPILFLV